MNSRNHVKMISCQDGANSVINYKLYQVNSIIFSKIVCCFQLFMANKSPKNFY